MPLLLAPCFLLAALLGACPATKGSVPDYEPLGLSYQGEVFSLPSRLMVMLSVLGAPKKRLKTQSPLPFPQACGKVKTEMTLRRWFAMAWTYCLNTSTIQPASLSEKIKAAAQAGYQAIELWFSDVRAYQNEGGSLNDLIKMLEDNGLQVPSMIALHGWMDAYGDTYIKAMEECKGLLSLAASLGSKRVVASPSMRLEPSPLNVDEAAQRFGELMKMGREVGVLPMMEFLGFSPKVSRVDQAWEIVQRVNDPEATVVLDPFHLWRGGSSLDDVPDLMGDRIGILHFNDVPTGIPREVAGDDVRVMPGDGALPLKELIAEVKRRGYEGVISLELFNRSYWQQDPYEVAKIGLEKMRGVVEG